MGKTILTPTQHIVLERFASDKVVTDWFYFTGGTALAEFYLHHRLSEDLDLFSETPIHHGLIDDLIQAVCNELKASFEKKSIMGHAIFTLHFNDKTFLKIDFVYQPFKRLEIGIKYKELSVVSLWDIIVDKLYTIFHRARARDFVDFYFAFQEVGCDLDQLINAMEEKYQANFDKISLLSRLPIVKEVIDYPTMLVPFDKNKMLEFYSDLILDMEKEVFN